MNVYDFDGTIYDGDSTADYIKYCLKHYPKTRKWIFVMGWAFLLYIIGVYDKTRFKEKMYGFFKYVPEGALSKFWDEHIKNIKQWYGKTQKADDVVITASPEFLVEAACKRIGIKTTMGSRVDRKTGKYDGLNCRDTEKIRRLYEWKKDAKVNKFYSDSYADTPLAELADEAYMVKGETLYRWEEYKPSLFGKLKKMFLNREFFMFVFVGVVNTLSNIVVSTLYNLWITNATLAFVAGYVTVNVLAYILNSVLTFKERLSVVRYVKFFISYIPNFIIQTSVVWLFDTFIHGPSVVAYAVAAIIGVPVTFIFMKIFAFKKKNK